MFIIIGFMFSGFLTGWLLKRFKLPYLSRIIMFLIWVLLFLLGVDVGSNDSIIHNLSTLGVEALILTSAAVLGSVIAACGLWKYSIRSRKIKL